MITLTTSEKLTLSSGTTLYIDLPNHKELSVRVTTPYGYIESRLMHESDSKLIDIANSKMIHDSW